jgi:hypothetical protein
MGEGRKEGKLKQIRTWWVQALIRKTKWQETYPKGKIKSAREEIWEQALGWSHSKGSSVLIYIYTMNTDNLRANQNM